MSETLIADVAGVLLSLLCSYAPGVKGWFGALSGEKKRLVMLGLLALAAGGIYGVACIGYSAAVVSPTSMGISCDKAGAWKLLEVFVAAAIANQAAYTFTPKAG